MEVRKRSASTGALVPYQACYYSSMFTGWKRVYVERDKMFRRGGLLYEDGDEPVVIPVGSATLKVMKGPGGAQLDNLNIGDKIAIFDAQRTFESPHDEAYIGSIDRTSYGNYALITLKKSDLATDYQTKYSYTTSPMDSGTHYPNFSKGYSAGVGVVSDCDCESNQINSSNSCFYDADMRAIQKTFNDAFVEFIGLRDGMGAVPYLPQSWFDWAFADVPGQQGIPAGLFSQIWFKNKNPWPPPNQHINYQHNYFHLIGSSKMTNSAGQSARECDFSFIFRGSIEADCIYSCLQEEKDNCTKETTNHELAHQFGVNSLCNWHCLNNAWCGESGGECANPSYGYEWCIMHPYVDNAQLYWDMRKDGIYKMDCDELAAQYSGCGLANCSNGISVRTDVDPE